MSTPPSMSIVVPCYNEQAVLPETVSRLNAKLNSLIANGSVAANSNIFLVDDGSVDQTWSLIEGFAEKMSTVRGIKLSRNSGHQSALMAGLMSADGDIIVSIDADLQDDPDAIDQMVEKHSQGCEIVYGVRSVRTSDTAFKRIAAEFFYSALRKIGVKLVYNHADYRLLSRRAVEALKEFTEVNLFLRGIVPLLGLQSGEVYYERHQRLAGKSKYSIRRMLALAVEGVTSFSNVPIRAITVLGFLTALLAFAMLFWVLYIKLLTSDAVPGWASILVPLFFLSGVQLFCLGVLGEYIAKIYSETKRRPLYLIEKIVP
jgi:glycosyltransferase involved in cell wall biosynthesis